MGEFDPDKVEGLDWDEGNRWKSETKHGVTEQEAEQVFANAPLVVEADVAHSQHESRYHALGSTNAGRLLHVTFTLRLAGTRLRVISARDMHRKEKKIYDQEA